MTGSTDSSNSDGFAFYHYDPSIGAAIIFILLFIGTTGYHIVQMFRTSTWFFIPFVLGGVCPYIFYASCD